MLLYWKENSNKQKKERKKQKEEPDPPQLSKHLLSFGCRYKEI